MPFIDLKSVIRLEDSHALQAAIGDRTVILASSSPRRRQILKACNVSFRQTDPGIDEPLPPARHHRAWVRRWAMRKAFSAKQKLYGAADLIFAADTIVVHRGKGLGKPKDADEAAAMLRLLSGDTHEVITGIAVASAQCGHSAGSAESRVRFRRLSRREIADYVASDEPFGKAGAYAIQGRAGQFVTSVEGPVDNVVGLPVRRLAQVTRRVLG
jgi:septum formation protein